MHNQYALDVIKSDSELKTIYQLFASPSLFADTRLIIKNPWFVEKSRKSGYTILRAMFKRFI